MFILLERLLLVVAGSWVLGFVLDKWIISGVAQPRLLRRAGVTAMVLMILAALHWSRAEPILASGLETSPRAAVIIIRGTLLLVGLLLVVGLVRIAVTLTNHNRIPGEVITTELLARYRDKEVIDNDTEAFISRRRIQFERLLREWTGNNRLQFLWVGDCHLPFTTGFFIPTVSCPLWISQVEEGEYLEVLLRHEALHVKLGHHRTNLAFAIVGAMMPWLRPLVDAVQCSLEMEVDQMLAGESGSQAKQYIEALVAVVGRAEETALVGIGHDPRRLVPRLARLQGTKGSSVFWFSASLASSLVLLGCSVGIGTPEPRGFMKILRQDLGRDLRIGFRDPGLLVFRTTKPAGILDAGVVADTTRITRPGLYIEPVGEKEYDIAGTLKYHIKYELSGYGENPPTVLAFGQTMGPFGPPSWQRESIVHDLDFQELVPSKQETTITLNHGPALNGQTRWFVQGPRFLVPKGWKVLIKDVRLEVERGPGAKPDAGMLARKWQAYLGLMNRIVGSATNEEVINLSWASKNGITGIN